MTLTLARDDQQVPHFGVFEAAFTAENWATSNPFDVDLTVDFIMSDDTTVTAEGFYDGRGVYRVRAYARALGEWRWQTRSDVPALSGRSGSFTVVSSELKGQLRHHPDDPHQFAYDNGEWFLHIGDTGYRFVADTEPEWRAYIDQAAAAGFTKIRTWFSRGRRDVQALFNADRTTLNLPYWQEMDRRLTYALNAHPDVMFKLIPYGEDKGELRRYHEDPLTRSVARYAQARFSAFQNVHWCVSNDQEMVPDGTELTGRMVHEGSIHQIARDMLAREPWGTLLTNHQCRFKGYSFCDADWSDIVTLEDLDQVDGRLILEYRQRAKVPIINDEDRYEHYRPPAHPRYFFRRLMWASLLSGGHTTYCGTVTFEAYDGQLRGIQGYYDAARAGKLVGGQDFRNLHVFFNDTGLTLVGFEPDDAFVGGRPEMRKCTRNSTTTIIYLANPDGAVPETDAMAATIPDVTFNADGPHSARWFNPRSGNWQSAGAVPAGMTTLLAPDIGDWVLLLRRDDQTGRQA